MAPASFLKEKAMHQARLMLDSAHREFLRKAIPWTRKVPSKRKPQLDSKGRPM